MLPSWGSAGESCFYVTSEKDEGLSLSLRTQGWKTVILSEYHFIRITTGGLQNEMHPMHTVPCNPVDSINNSLNCIRSKLPHLSG